MDGLLHQTQFRIFSILVFHLLLVSSCRGKSQLIGPPQPVVATLGDDVILSCRLEPGVDATHLEWTRPDLNPRFVHVWRDNHELVNKKHPLYEGRTSLFMDELNHRNISLKLSKVKVSDEGRYRCFIPTLGIDCFVSLLVGSVSSPVISLSGTDRKRGAVVLACEANGWYPEPEVSWLDGEGRVFSAGHTETVRGPDGLYTISNRVTVEKIHSNTFTCSLRHKHSNQTRDAQIQISDDFFVVQTSPAIYIIAGVAVGFVSSLVCFAVWKLKQKQIKNKRNQNDETDGERKTKDVESGLLTDGERQTERVMMAGLKKGGKKKKKLVIQMLQKNLEDTQRELHEEKQRREEAEEKNMRLEKEHEKMKSEHEKLEKDKKALEDVQQMVGDEPEQTGAVSQSTSQTPGSSYMKTRETHSGTVSVDEIDLKGNYFRIRNNSMTRTSLIYWKMKIEVDKDEPIECKLPPTFTIRAGETITIWASDSDRSHYHPNDVVLRNQKSWIFRDHIKVSLLHPYGKEKAMRELTVPKTV